MLFDQPVKGDAGDAEFPSRLRKIAIATVQRRDNRLLFTLGPGCLQR